VCARARVPETLMMQAYYNGNYAFHGAKVQHFIEVDSMVIVFWEPLRVHDSRVLRNSSVEEMLSIADVGGNPALPAIGLGDQAYANTRNISAKTRAASLRVMNPGQRLLRQCRDRSNMQYRNCVELTFQKTMAMWPINSMATKTRLFADGRSNWGRMKGIWNTQILFQNLHTCCYGAQTTGVFHTDPPSVDEYLYNINNGLMVVPP
jgi:hypothetical protein